MRRHALLLVAAGLLLAADNPKDDASKADLDKMQGNWKVSSLTVNGEPAPAEKIQDVRLTVKGNKFAVKLADQTVELAAKLDATKKVKEIDLTYDTGDNKGKTHKAIYKLEGDTMTMCRPQEAGNERPTEFASKAGSMHILTVWKRDK
jgi:uncharacterized protein (TIGR03067 family)